MLAARVSVHGAGALERRPPHERRPSRQHVLDPGSVDRDGDPVADGDVGTEVADPARLAVIVAGQQRAPPTIDARHSSRRSRGAERAPSVVPFGVPAERRQLLHRFTLPRPCCDRCPRKGGLTPVTRYDTLA